MSESTRLLQAEISADKQAITRLYELLDRNGMPSFCDAWRWMCRACVRG